MRTGGRPWTILNVPSTCGIAEEQMYCDRVVGSNPTWHWAFSTLYQLINVTKNWSREEVKCYWFSFLLFEYQLCCLFVTSLMNKDVAKSKRLPLEVSWFPNENFIDKKLLFGESNPWPLLSLLSSRHFSSLPQTWIIVWKSSTVRTRVRSPSAAPSASPRPPTCRGRKFRSRSSNTSWGIRATNPKCSRRTWTKSKCSKTLWRYNS